MPKVIHFVIAAFALAVVIAAAGVAVVQAQGNPSGSLGCQAPFVDCNGVCTMPAECTSGQGGTGEQGGTGGQGNTGGQQEPTTYLGNLYRWFLGFVGVAALFAIVYGGVLYMFSGANITQVGEAKKWISNAIFGIVLAAASYLLLNTINPDLVQGLDFDTIITNACQSAGIRC